jgi:hypothetical protein
LFNKKYKHRIFGVCPGVNDEVVPVVARKPADLALVAVEREPKVPMPDGDLGRRLPDVDGPRIHAANVNNTSSGQSLGAIETSIMVESGIYLLYLTLCNQLSVGKQFFTTKFKSLGNPAKFSLS